MIEIENDLNRYNCTFDDPELNVINYIEVNKTMFINSILRSLENLNCFESLLDSLVKKYPDIILHIRKFNVNYLEFFVYSEMTKRVLELIGMLVKCIKLKDEKEINFDENKMYYMSYISLEYPDDSKIVFEKIMNKFKLYIPTIEEDNENDKKDKKLNNKIKIDEQEKCFKAIEIYSNKENELVKMCNNNHIPSIRMLYYLFTKLNIILENSITTLKFLEESKTLKKLKSKSKEKINLITFLQNSTKLSLMSEIVFNVFTIPHDDLFDLSIESEEWKEIKKHYHYYMIESKCHLQESMNKFLELFIVGNAAISQSYDMEKEDLNFKSHMYMAYYFLNTGIAKYRYSKISINPSFTHGKAVWNLLDSKVIKDVNKLGYPSISKRNSYELKVSYYEFSSIELNSLYDDFINGKKSEYEPYLDVNEVQIKNDNELKQMKETMSKSNVFKTIKLKFLAPSKGSNHVPDFYFHKGNCKCCCGNNNSLDLTNSKPGDIIFHIHGGGFVAMSSSSHEMYLRKWSNKLGIPIISVDYTLSPKVSFPVALNEIYYSYLWLIEKSGIKINKIIIAGDSAGGNFAFSLTNMLIITGKRLPDFISSAYPALHLSKNAFSPCMLLAIDDIILPYSSINYALEAYLGNVNGDLNHFASPGLIKNEVMKNYPKTNIYLGSSDPLRDQTLRFVNRLM